MSADLRPYQRPHVAQLEAVLAERNVAHDGSDCGTGKTFCAAAILAKLRLEPLVICPFSVVEDWERVLLAFNVKATVINYELAWRRLGKLVPWGKGSFFEWTNRWPCVVYDESHRTGGETSNQSKMLIASVRQKSKILSLSATAAHSPMKLKALGYALGLHSLTNFRDWTLSYGYVTRDVELKNGHKFKKLSISKENNAKAMELLNEQIFGHGARGARMRKEEIPDFPKTTIDIRLLRQPADAIAKLSDELRAFYAERNLKAALTADDLGKQVFLRQALEIAKLPDLLDMIEDALESSRVCVFVNFTKTIMELAKAVTQRGWSHGMIKGDMDPDIRARGIVDFRANRTAVMLCNIQAGGVGVSLHDPVTQVPRTSLICPTYNAVDLKQVLGRVQRTDGGFSTQYLVYFAGTHEERVARSVQRKMSNIDLLNDGDISDDVEHPASDLTLS